MPIDTSIYGNLQPAKFDSPLTSLAQLAQVQNAQNQNALFPLHMQQLQMANQQSQQKFDLLKDYIGNMGGGQQASQPTQQNIGGQSQGADAQKLKRLEALAIAGIPGAKEAFEIYKYQTDGVKRDAGSYYKDPVTGETKYYADPKSGVTIDPNSNAVSALPGAPQALGQVAGAVKSAETAGVNSQTLAPLDRVDPRTGRPYAATTGQLVDTVNNPSSSSFTVPQIPPILKQHIDQVNASGDPKLKQSFIASVTDAINAGNKPPEQKQAVLQEFMRQMSAGQQQSPQSNAQFAMQANSDNASFGGFAGPGDLAQMAADVKAKNDPRLSYANDANKNFADYEKGLNARVSTGGDLMMRIQESRNALQKFQSGGGMEARSTLAQYAQAFGAPNSMVDKIAGGDLSAAQEFSKLAAQQAMETLKQSMDGSGRITQAEFKVFQQNNPNLNTDPRAIEKIYNFATKVFGRDKAESDALAQYKSVPNADMTQFPNWWAGESQKRGFVNPQQVNGQAKGAAQPTQTSQALPMPTSKTSLAVGKTYQTARGAARWDGNNFVQD